MRASDLRQHILAALAGEGVEMSPAQLAVMLPEAFFASQLKLVDDRWAGKPFIMAPHVRDSLVHPVLGTLSKRTCQRVYTEALVGWPRKHAKTTSIAGLALYFLFMEAVPGQQILSVAYDKDQARIALGMGRRMISYNPLLLELCGGKTYRDVIYIPELDAEWRIMPHKGADLQGAHPRIVICDEPHTYPDMDVVNSLRSGMGGREEPLLLGITTVGPDRKGPLWDWLKAIKRDPHGYVHWIGAADSDDANDPKVWRRVNVAPWITMAYLRDEHRRLHPADFERYHLNRWPTQGVHRAIPAAAWHACHLRPKFDDELPMILGLDASFTRDSTALVAVQKDGKGFYHVYCWVWEKDDVMGHIDHAAVEAKIIELCETYNVTRIACDPNYFSRSMLKLQNEFRLPIEDFPQNSQRMCAATMTLYDVIQERRLRHGGAPILTRHVLNAGRAVTAYGWRLTKVSDDEKIDAAVALAMAVQLAESDVPVPSFASTGGVWSVPLG